MALPKVTAPTYELELPSTGKKVKYRPFLVKEEKLLLIATDSGDENQITQAVMDVMTACIITRGVKPENLASFDLEYLFLKIRAASVGEEIVLNVRCLDDNTTEVSHTVNINTIEVFKPEGHSDKIMLSDKVGVIMKYPSMMQFIRAGFISDPDADPLDIVVDTLDQIFEGEEITEASDCTKKELKSFIESLTQEQFQKLTQFFETMPRLQHTFEVTNPNTGKTSTFTIEGLQNFFA